MKASRVALFFGVVIATCVCGSWPGLAIAQGLAAGFPTRPITIVLTFPPGGPADAETRMYTPLFQAEEVVGSTPEYFARVIMDHAAVWKRVIRENNIMLEE